MTYDRLEVEDDTGGDLGPWGRPAVVLRAAASKALDDAHRAATDPYDVLQALAALDQECRRIAQAVKGQRVVLVREMVAEHGVGYTAAVLEVDPSTIRHLAPQHARFQRAAHPKAREKQAVELYRQGWPLDAVVKRLRMGHRRVKRVVIAAGIPLRETHASRAKEDTT